MAASSRKHLSFTRLTSWLTFTALLAGSATPGRAAVTVAPACRVEGHPEVELTLACGDGTQAGVVQRWQTPFGDVRFTGFHGDQDPVFVRRDGSLVVPNSSGIHSGLYVCLLQHAAGATLWPYELHVGGAFRVQRSVGSEGSGGVSDGQFAGAVAASVLLAFVFGFSAGAVSRTPVLRCLRAVRKRRPDHGSDVTMTTLPPECDGRAFEVEEVTPTPSPPTKPQRSFRLKQHEQETTAYLEGCGYRKEEEQREEQGEEQREEEQREEEQREEEEREEQREEEQREEEQREEEERKEEQREEGGRLEERNEGCDEEGRGDSRKEEEEEERSKGEEEEEEQREEGGRLEERNKGREEVERRESREEEEKEEKDGGESREEEEEKRSRGEDDDEETDDSEDKDTGSRPPGSSPSPLRPGRRSRVIRLYQYDDDGQRYGHLADSAPDEPGPAPKLKHRSLSLTRLSAIMAAASAGPLDERETGREEARRFHMEI